MLNLKANAARLSAALACSLVMSAGVSAAPIVYGFDGLADGLPLSTQYAGLAFSQATVLVAGASLNEYEFPPRSLDGVVFDDGGPITIDFATSVFSVAGYFTYADGLSFSAYDRGGRLLGTVAAAYTSNRGDGAGDFGSSPNEFLQFSDTAGLISRVVFMSSASGASFLLDDLTVDAGAVAAVAEPSALGLMAAGLFMALARRRRR